MQDGDRVFLRPVKGSLADLKGIFADKIKGPVDYRKLREKVKEQVALEVREEME